MVADTGAKFRYDPEKHEYWLGDQLLPHPTGLSIFSRCYDDIPPEKLFVAREFGKSVHEYLAAYNRGELDINSEFPSDPDEKTGYDMGAIVRGYDQIYRDNVFVPQVVEEPMMNKEFRYGCTPDFISGDLIGDFKPWSQRGKGLIGLQLAANAGAAISNRLVNKEKVKLLSLHYDPWGKWALQYWPFKENWNLWMCALTLHNAKIGV